MELSFTKLKRLNIPEIERKHSQRRKCANGSKEMNLLTNASVWIHKENGKNWCFKVTEIPDLLKTRVNPHTGVKFTDAVLANMSHVKQQHLESFLHPEKILPINYLDNKRRLAYIQDLQKGLIRVRRVLKSGKQCMNDSKQQLLRYLNAVRTISAGSFGSVAEGCYPLDPVTGKCEDYPFRFAIKEARVEKRSLKKSFDAKNDDWHESIILRDLINPLIKDGVCPNLPLLFDTFTCETCSMNLLEGKYKGACAVSILELADGTLHDFLASSPEEPELWSALFQICAALHAVQYYYQMFHNDIKSVNILYYNVVPGGYWRYTIHGKDYNVPNLGKLFVLSDFGVSYPLHPQSDLTYKTGIRYCIVAGGKCSAIRTNPSEKNAKDLKWNGDWVSLVRQYRTGKGKVTAGKELLLDDAQKKFLGEIGIPSDTTNPKFYAFSEIVPPLEFRYDLQDVLRSFVGGKRTTQDGSHHAKYSLTPNFRARVEKYVDKTLKGDIRSTTDSATLATAGYFIGEMFSKWRRAKKPVIDHYDIS